MQQFVRLLCLGCILVGLPVVAEEFYYLGGDTGYYESRYSRAQSGKSVFYLQRQTDSNAAILENRAERFLGSIYYQNEWLYLSTGHRYTPLDSFLLFKDKEYFSAFTNYANDILAQPLRQSSWLGLWPNSWGLGGFLAGKHQGVYMHAPEQMLSFAISDNLSLAFASLHLPSFVWPVGKGVLRLKLHAEVVREKQQEYGYFNSFMSMAHYGLELESSIYREQADAQQKRNISTIPPSVRFLQISRYHYNRIQVLYSDGEDRHIGLVSANLAILVGFWGAICASGRYYQVQQKGKQEQNSIAYGLSYEYRFYKSEMMFRLEKRNSGGRLAEIQLALYPAKYWKFAVSALWQANQNRFPSMFRDWADGIIVFTNFTEKQWLLRLKLAGGNFVFLASTSRDKLAVRDSYFANVQYRKKFDF
ncbi:MAG: hypothetical protein AAF518_24540 [Spirochaetota bacterium]